jgi:hypothetical protein
LPRWREYKVRGAFLSARISRVGFGTDDRNDVAKYIIAVEVPGHAARSEHDADPGFQEFNRLADLLQPEDPLYTAERCCTPSDRAVTVGVVAGAGARGQLHRGMPAGALMFASEYDMRQAGSWDESRQTVTTATICPCRGVGCNLGTARALQPDRGGDLAPRLRVGHGHLGVKGRFGFEFVQRRAREF